MFALISAISVRFVEQMLPLYIGLVGQAIEFRAPILGLANISFARKSRSSRKGLPEMRWASSSARSQRRFPRKVLVFSPMVSRFPRAIDPDKLFRSTSMVIYIIYVMKNILCFELRF